MSPLNQALRAALDQRQDLINELHAQGTDCYRLFHGSQEGAGGADDRPLRPAVAGTKLPPGAGHPRAAGPAPADQQYARLELTAGVQRPLAWQLAHRPRTTVYRAEPAALEDLVGHEWGLNYRVRGHVRRDPLLFLDLLPRGWVRPTAAKSCQTCLPIRVG